MGIEDLINGLENITKKNTRRISETWEWEVKYWDPDNDCWKLYQHTRPMSKQEIINYGKKESVEAKKSLHFSARSSDKPCSYTFKDGEIVTLDELAK